jgi:hypothetical protein
MIKIKQNYGFFIFEFQITDSPLGGDKLGEIDIPLNVILFLNFYFKIFGIFEKRFYIKLK